MVKRQRLRPARKLGVGAGLVTLLAATLSGLTFWGSAHAETVTLDDLEFEITSARVAEGLYQSAYSERNQVLWVTSAVGTPPVRSSELLKVDPDSLEVLDRIVPPTLDEGTDGWRLEAVYGVGVDDTNNTVWTTSTREDAVAVYDQATGEHLATVPDVVHARDVVIDEHRGHAYVSEAWPPSQGGGTIVKIDTETYEVIYKIALGDNAQPMALELIADENTSKVYTTDLNNGAVYVLDNLAQNVETFWVGEQWVGQSGIAVDAERQQAFVSNQWQNSVTHLDLTNGTKIADLPGQSEGNLNIAYDADNDLVFATEWWGSGLNVYAGGSGEHLGNLPVGAFPNHVTVANNAVYVAGRANSYGGEGGPDHLWKITIGDADDDGGDPGDGDGGDPGDGDGGDPGDGDGDSADVDVTVEVPQTDGGLLLSLPQGASASLGEAALTSDASEYTASGDLPTVAVTDLRSTDPGWSLVGKVSEFEAGDAASFSGNHLGWQPSVVSAEDGQSVVPGSAADSGLADGLTLATAEAGAGRGTAEIGALLSLRVPSSVTPDTYHAVLTVTLS